MSVTAGVTDTANAFGDKLRGKLGQTKVKRYWPGRAPEWADDADEEGDFRAARAVTLEQAFPASDDADVPCKDDPRLRRLARVDNKEEVRAAHRCIRQAEIVSTIEEENKNRERLGLEEQDEVALEERRKRIREKLLQQQKEEATLPAVEEEEEAEEEEEKEEESEYETDSDEEQLVIAMVKPIFLPKFERDTIADMERIEAEERALEEMVNRRLEERKVETRQIVVEEVRKDEEIQKNLDAGVGIADVDTDDENNEAEEYEAWKTREIARLKRDREGREATMKLKEEIEKVRNLTEEERREWERRNPKPLPASKQKWRFMQKYYHKGAFFQSNADDRMSTAGTDAIYERNFSAPTGEDKMDKSILPKVMQVKHFGRSGRTKWTHLVNEDTADWKYLWTFDDTFSTKYNAKMTALNAPIARPKGSKKLKDWELR